VDIYQTFMNLGNVCRGTNNADNIAHVQAITFIWF